MKDAYIGLTDQKVEGKFEWNINHNSKYTNWCPGEPNDDYSMEDVVLIKHEYQKEGCWNDIYDFFLAYFICEIP